MSIRWVFDEFIAECDICGKVLKFAYERDDFRKVVDELKTEENGWRNFKEKDAWRNACPTCYANKFPHQEAPVDTPKPQQDGNLSMYLLALGNLNCCLRNEFDGIVIVMVETKGIFNDSLKEILLRHGMTIGEKHRSVQDAIKAVNQALVDATEGTLLDRYNNNKHLIK